MDIQHAAEEQKIHMAKSVKKAKEKLNAVEKLMKKQTELMKKSEEQISTAEKDVTETVNNLLQFLKKHGETIKAELVTIRESQQGYHQNNMENFQLFATQLRSSVEYCEEIVQRNISHEILQTGHAVLDCCEELLETEEIELYKPEHVMFLQTDDELLGQVVVSHTDPSQSVAEGEGLREAELGAEVNFSVTTRNSDGIQSYNDQDQVSVKVCSPANQNEEMDSQDFEDGNYTVHYRPKSVGLHDISVKVNGKPLTGSPWSVPVTPHQYKHVRSLRPGGKRREKFNDLLSVAVSESTGNIAIADDDDKRVYLFDSEEKYLRTIGDKWTSTKKINQPRSVAFTASGEVIVINGETSENYKMYVFTEGGQFVKQIRRYLSDPSTVSVANDGNLIACDWDNKKVTVLSPDGTELVRSFRAPDCVELPSFAFYHKDRFFVSYQGAHCINVFNKEGVFLYQIGSEGSGDGQFRHPSGIIIDKFNNLIVCDCGNDRLQVFALDGKFLNSVKEVEAPFAIAVTKDGDLLVCAYDCVQVFH